MVRPTLSGIALYTKVCMYFRTFVLFIDILFQKELRLFVNLFDAYNVQYGYNKMFLTNHK